MSNRIITGIDVGTYHIKVAVTRVPTNGPTQRPEIIGTGTAESRGMKNGYIVNEAEVAHCIKQAVAQAEKSAGIPIKQAYVALGSIGLDEVYSHGEVIPARADSEITSHDLEKVLQDSEERIQDHIPNRQILHPIPLLYRVDGAVVLGRPNGLKGTKLEVESLFITSFEQHINDLISAIEAAGVRVDDISAAPLAASYALLTKAQRRAGCILTNIGAETTSIAVYEDSMPISVKIFPVGSNDITNDIALGLRIPLEEAEKIKRGGLINATYSKKKLDEIISQRLDSIFTLINAHLQHLKRDGLLPAGVILTGGGATLPHAIVSAKTVLNLPARTATLELAKSSKLRDVSWAVAYGLCMWGASGGDDAGPIGSPRKQHKNPFAWFTQFLP